MLPLPAVVDDLESGDGRSWAPTWLAPPYAPYRRLRPPQAPQRALPLGRPSLRRLSSVHLLRSLQDLADEVAPRARRLLQGPRSMVLATTQAGHRQIRRRNRNHRLGRLPRLSGCRSPRLRPTRNRRGRSASVLSELEGPHRDRTTPPRTPPRAESKPHLAHHVCHRTTCWEPRGPARRSAAS